MTPKQLTQLEELRSKLFTAMLVDSNPENWIGFGKTVMQLTKQERDEATWCRRQASSSILLWEKIDKLINQFTEPQSKQLSLADIDIDSFEQEANELLAELKAKEHNEK